MEPVLRRFGDVTIERLDKSKEEMQSEDEQQEEKKEETQGIKRGFFEEAGPSNNKKVRVENEKKEEVDGEKNKRFVDKNKQFVEKNKKLAFVRKNKQTVEEDEVLLNANEEFDEEFDDKNKKYVEKNLVEDDKSKVALLAKNKTSMDDKNKRFAFDDKKKTSVDDKNKKLAFVDRKLAFVDDGKSLFGDKNMKALEEDELSFSESDMSDHMSDFNESEIESDGELILERKTGKDIAKCDENERFEDEESASFLDDFASDDDEKMDKVEVKEEKDDDYEFDIKEKLKEMGEISFETVKKSDKPKKSDSADSEVVVTKKGVEEENVTLPKGGVPMRRNIREVMDETKLDESTLAAQRQEAERLRRVQEQQKLIRELQRQVQQERVLSLLQGGSKAGPSGTRIGSTVLVKLPNGQTKPMTKLSKRPFELMRVPKSAVPLQTHPRSLIAVKKPGTNLTPSVSIAPIGKKPLIPTVKQESDSDSDMEDLKKPVNRPKPKEPVATIDISSDDDCIVVSETENEPDDEPDEDPSNSGMHTNDEFNQPDEQGRVVINIGHPENESDIYVAPQLARIIKPHQIGGVRFLFDNVVESVSRFETSTGFGCILAHSMGLGKTLQVACFSDIFLRHTTAKTILCIMPINTLQNWMAEFNMWLPTEEAMANSPLKAQGEVRPRNFNLHVLNDSHKTLTARAKVIREWTSAGGVLLIGYEQFRLLSLRKNPKSRKKGQSNENADDDKNKVLFDEVHTALVKPGPDLVICDEGHRIKNSHASISQALKQMKTKRRVVLTGYPLQNNLMEYWCMVDFVRPNYLGSKTEFCNMFERPIQNGQCIDSTESDIKLMRYRAHVLHSLLVGFVQRRSHRVLQSALPQKEEYVLLVRMTDFQRKLYETFMNEVVRCQTVPNPLKAFAVCCKIWNHPDVLYYFLKKDKGEVDIDLEEVANSTVEATGKNKRGVPKKTAKKDAKDGNKPSANITPYKGETTPKKNSKKKKEAATPTNTNTNAESTSENTNNFSFQKNLNFPNTSENFNANSNDSGLGSTNQSAATNYQYNQSNFPTNFPVKQEPFTNYGFNASPNSYNQFSQSKELQTQQFSQNDKLQAQNYPAYNQNYNASNYSGYTANYENAAYNTNSYSDNYNSANYNSQNSGGKVGYTGNNDGQFDQSQIATEYQQNFGQNRYGQRQFARNEAVSNQFAQNEGNRQNNQFVQSEPCKQNTFAQTESAPNKFVRNENREFAQNESGSNFSTFNLQQTNNQAYNNANSAYNYTGENHQSKNRDFANKNQTNTDFNSRYPTGSDQNSSFVQNVEGTPGNFSNQYSQNFNNKNEAFSQQNVNIKSEGYPQQNFNNKNEGFPQRNFQNANYSNFPSNQEGNYQFSNASSQNQNFSNQWNQSEPYNNKNEYFHDFKQPIPPNNENFSNNQWIKKEEPNTAFKTENATEIKPKINILSDIKLSDSFEKLPDSKEGICKEDIKLENLGDTSLKTELNLKKTDANKEETKSEIINLDDDVKILENNPTKSSTKEDTGIPYDWAVELLKDYVPGIIENSAKMQILFSIIKESLAINDRLLVFSQSLITLDLIEQFLQMNVIPGEESQKWVKNTSYFRLDGSTSALEREKLINEFNSNSKVYLFLVSTRAGSLGINLIGANRVIVLDASWNPCHDTQAVCRVYRYGQKKQCYVYRLVVDKCLEKKIYDRQINKQGMSDRVVDECNPDAHLTMKDVSTLCWDDEKEEEEKDWSFMREKYTDPVLKKVMELHGKCFNKEPFQHESLLVDRKDKQLSLQEKRLAKKGYEREKLASRQPSYNTATLARGHRPVASVRPMQQGDRPARFVNNRWIPAEHWQRQGMTAQEMTLPLDVVIPTNQPEKGNIVLKAGQKVLILKSPKGVYMQLESGKIVAIRTAIKVRGKAEEDVAKAKVLPTLKNHANFSVIRRPLKPFAPGVTKLNMRSIKQPVPNLVSRIQSVTKKLGNGSKSKPYQIGAEIARAVQQKDPPDLHHISSSDEEPKNEEIEKLLLSNSKSRPGTLSKQHLKAEVSPLNAKKRKEKSTLEKLEQSTSSIITENKKPYKDTLETITNNYRDEENINENSRTSTHSQNSNQTTTHVISDHELDDEPQYQGTETPNSTETNITTDPQAKTDIPPSEYNYNYYNYNHMQPYPPPQGYPGYPQPPPYDAYQQPNYNYGMYPPPPQNYPAQYPPPQNYPATYPPPPQTYDYGGQTVYPYPQQYPPPPGGVYPPPQAPPPSTYPDYPYSQGTSTPAPPTPYYPPQ